MDTQKPFLLDQWVPEALEVDLQLVQAASEEAVSAEVAEDSTALEEAVVSVVEEVASKIADEEVLATKAEEGLAETAEGSVVRTDTELLPLVLLPDQAADVVEVVSEEVMVVPVPQIEMAPLQVVGMIRALVVAHMMTETADIAAVAVAMEIAMDPLVVEVAAIWSR